MKKTRVDFFFVNLSREFHNVASPEKKTSAVYCTWYYHADNYNEEILKNDIIQFIKEHLPVASTFWIPSEEGFELKKVNMSPGQRKFFLDY